MPLTGDPSIDIPELMETGRPQKQAVAIALKKERGDDDCDEVKEDEAEEKKDVVDESSLMAIVERIRGDMAERKEALDRLTGNLYTASSRLKRIENS